MKFFFFLQNSKNQIRQLWNSVSMQNIFWPKLKFNNFFNAIFLYSFLLKDLMDYKKKSLSKLNRNESYEEIDTRLASGWYVDGVGSTKTKKYKTKKVSFKISKKV